MVRRNHYGIVRHIQKTRTPERIKEAGQLFCPEPDPRKTLNQVEELLQIQHTGDSNILTLKNGDIEIVLLAACPDDEGENGQYAKGQLSGVAGYVYHIETVLTNIKCNLFYHLRQCKSLIQIIYSFDSTGPAETAEKEKQVRVLLLGITEKLQGVVTFGDGMALLNGQGQVILDKEGKSELEYYMPAELQPGLD